jgi:hypothetical protein
MPESIPKGLTREHVLLALAALDAGIDHDFGKPTKYEFVHDGNSYALKDDKQDRIIRNSYIAAPCSFCRQ